MKISVDNTFKVKPLLLPTLSTRLLTLNHVGVVKQTTTGYVYLDITNQYFDELYPLLPDPKHPPTHYNTLNDIGSHISIIYEDEQPILKPIVEKTLEFNIEGLFEVEVLKQRYIVLLVDAPALEHLRAQQGLPPFPVYRGTTIHFHITLARLSS